MEEIKVGDYCKDIYGRIGKIKSYSNGTYFTGKFGANSGEIVIHSPNIIDLIQEGDYVNGYIVLDIMEDIKTGELHLEMPMDYTNKELGDCTIYNKDIKSIVTHEQFKAIEYRVEKEK